VIGGAAALLLAGGSRWRRATNFATGNMHFERAGHVITNGGSHDFTRDEMIQYRGAKQWEMMAHGKGPTIPIRGGCEGTLQPAAARQLQGATQSTPTMDGSISKDEFVAYGGQEIRHHEED